MRELFRESGVPVGYCPSCGYRYDGGICPECGRRFEKYELVLDGDLESRRRRRKKFKRLAVIAILVVGGYQILTRVNLFYLLPTATLVSTFKPPPPMERMTNVNEVIKYYGGRAFGTTSLRRDGLEALRNRLVSQGYPKSAAEEIFPNAVCVDLKRRPIGRESAVRVLLAVSEPIFGGCRRQWDLRIRDVELWDADEKVEYESPFGWIWSWNGCVASCGELLLETKRELVRPSVKLTVDLTDKATGLLVYSWRLKADARPGE